MPKIAGFDRQKGENFPESRGRPFLKGGTMQVELLPVTAFAQNCSLVWDEEKNAAIIDPGGDVEKILNRVEALGLKVQGIFLTHGHLDHVGAAVALKEKLSAPILGPHEGDKFWLDNLPQQSLQFGLFEAQAFAPDRWLKEGEKLPIGAMTFEVFHLPGHTPGHVGFVNREHKVAFTGDVLFQGSIGRTDFPRGNHQELLDSIAEKLYPLGDEMIIIPGHGQTTTIRQEQIHNPFLRSIRPNRQPFTAPMEK